MAWIGSPIASFVWSKQGSYDYSVSASAIASPALSIHSLFFHPRQPISAAVLG